MFRLGLIGGIISDELKADYFGTLAKVAEIGYEGIEGGGPLLEGDTKAVAETRRRVNDLGLEVVTIGARREGLGDGFAELVEKAKIIGARHITVFWGPCERKDQLLEDAARYQAAAVRCAEAGLKFCYHNHEHEFRTTFDGRYALDHLIENAPDLSIELDVAWVTFGGANPPDYIRAHPGRIPVIHLKDIVDAETRGAFTTVGTGIVDVAGSVRAAVQCGAEWVIVEQDRPRRLTGMETVLASFLNVKELVDRTRD